MNKPSGSPAKERPSILLVDDNPHGLIARKAVLQELGYRIETAACGGEALDIIARQKIHLVVTDYKMPEMNGIQLIARIRQTEPLMPIILLSGFVEPLGLTEPSTGADIVLPKSSGEAGFLIRSVNRLLNPATPRKPPALQRLRTRRAAGNAE
jgi:CheY-like chemotaxis protein